MSDLTGHYILTRTAVTELANGRPKSGIAQGLQLAGLPQAAVRRDILDVLNGGHWADFGQKHHFMRRFDGQSPYAAYKEAVHWIHSNSLVAASALADRIQHYFPHQSRGKPGERFRVQMMMQDIPWQSLGNAIHCLEDSFATGHVVRTKSSGLFRPGKIKHIKRYAGAELKDHEAGDEAWWSEPFHWFDHSEGHFSPSGRQAIEAVKSLLSIVLDTAEQQRVPHSLERWDKFKSQWLSPSPELRKLTDHVFELIDRHYKGIRRGADNAITFAFDEQGLAVELLRESTTTVLEVFQRLDSHFNSDSDDVAEIYINRVRAHGDQQISKLRKNPELVKLLIKVLDEGWTTDGENECIRFLKSLT